MVSHADKPEVHVDTVDDWEAFLENDAPESGVRLRLRKKNSTKPGITYAEALDVALCFGWIDGIRKRVGEISYQIRFTPRRRGSIWSATNIKRAKELARQEQMRPAGLKAFAARVENKSGIYSYE